MDPSYHDMFEDAGAQKAGGDYLKVIERALEARFGTSKVTILDAGCQAGRLLIPLARAGHRMIGVDRSAFSLRRAQGHAHEARVSVELHKGDILKVNRWVSRKSVDAAICAEVLYLVKNFPGHLTRLKETVRPGGLVFISHRPKVYYAAKALDEGRPGLAETIASNTEGPSPDGIYHNWQTPQELNELYTDLGLKILELVPIQERTWSLPPGLSLDHKVEEALSSVRAGDGAYRIPDYLLVVARRP